MREKEGGKFQKKKEKKRKEKKKLSLRGETLQDKLIGK